jgi:hypothetical protein
MRRPWWGIIVDPLKRKTAGLRPLFRLDWQ